MASMASARDFDEIPIVDYAKLATDRAQFFKDLEHALCDVGFMLLTNYPGLDQAFQHEALTAAHTFFELPQAEKDRCHMTTSPHFRGYYDFGGPGLAAEAYQFGRETAAPEDPSTPVWNKMRRGPNVWPRDRALLAPVMELFQRYFPLSRELGHLISELLEVPNERYDRYFSEEEPDFIAAMNHSFGANEYPEEARRTIEQRFAASPYGNGAHIDGAPFITLLVSDQAGLEVLKLDGRTWVDVPRVPGAVVVNIGGTLQYLSGGRMRATMHRVNPLKPSARRISLPYFLLPKLEEPLVKFDGKSAPHRGHRGVLYAVDRMNLFPLCTQQFYAREYEEVKAMDEEGRKARDAQVQKSNL